MSKTIEQIREELDAKIPRDAIATREGSGRRSLSYLEGWYVIDRLNKVLGQGNWSYTTQYEKVYEGKDDRNRSEVSYLAKVQLSVQFRQSEPGVCVSYFEDIGYGDGKDPHPGKAHESAIKEAVTDGLKRCAKNLGMSMGLALYDKSQENVDEGDGPAATIQPSSRARDSGGSAPQPSESVAGPDSADNTSSQAAPAPKQKTRAEILKLIDTTTRVITAKRLRTLDELREEMKSRFGVEKKDALTDAQAEELLRALKSLVA